MVKMDRHKFNHAFIRSHFEQRCRSTQFCDHKKDIQVFVPTFVVKSTPPRKMPCTLHTH